MTETNAAAAVHFEDYVGGDNKALLWVSEKAKNWPLAAGETIKR
jgi:hypothetical protein